MSVLTFERTRRYFLQQLGVGIDRAQTSNDNQTQCQEKNKEVSEPSSVGQRAGHGNDLDVIQRSPLLVVGDALNANNITRAQGQSLGPVTNR